MSFNRFVGLLLALAGLLLVGGAVGAGFFYFAFLRDLPDLQSVEDYKPPLATWVFDRDGRPIGELFNERRRLVPLEKVPPHVVNAFIASEDSSFYEHSGIDLSSILRAAWVNLRAGGEIRQGGSTITQQVVKGLLLTPERKIRRKIREMILARRIEKVFTKQEILYLYLNQIYFGHGAYGISEAARRYFGKNVEDLTVSEGAQLAGLPQAPSRYSAFANPDEANRRRLYVLGRMREEGFIDEETHRAAVAEIPALVDESDDSDFTAASYFTEEVRRYLFDALGGERVLSGGLSVETTLDLDLQKVAVAALRRGLVAQDHRQGYRGPVRRVPPADIEAELEKLRVENGFPAPAADGSAAAPVAPPELEVGDVRLGVVTGLDAATNVARVSFGGGLAGEVRMSDARWARPPDPDRAPYDMTRIGQVFAVGDVAQFELRERAVDAGGEKLSFALHQDPIVQGAVLSFDVETGDVLAMVGGYDFATSQFNRATQASRQPGSAFKPIIYGAAIERNYTPASIVYDRPVVYTDDESGFVWRPRNYGRSFYGPITLREALVHSVNNATVHLFRDVGVGFVIDYARRLGIEAPLNRDLSLALGSSGVTLLELTRAYGVFVNGGRRLVPRFIRRVLAPDGEVLLENIPLGVEASKADTNGNGKTTSAEAGAADATGGEDEQIIPARDAFLVTDMLRAVVEDPGGTGRRAKVLGRTVAGKTGTTNDQGDAWFMGFSPAVVTGVWVGHDESRYLGWGETGARAALPIWIDFMREALKKRPSGDFPVPEQIVFARIDRKTGLLADASSEDTVFQPFAVGTVPTESAQTARTDTETRRLLRNMDSF